MPLFVGIEVILSVENFSTFLASILSFGQGVGVVGHVFRMVFGHVPIHQLLALSNPTTVVTLHVFTDCFKEVSLGEHVTLI